MLKVNYTYTKNDNMIHMLEPSYENINMIKIKGKKHNYKCEFEEPPKKIFLKGIDSTFTHSQSYESKIIWHEIDLKGIGPSTHDTSEHLNIVTCNHAKVTVKGASPSKQ